ncbi:MAG TPA: TerB family tellurite resistance protein, partial [Gammaproteobacteria bacterium]|nr:TerB family tellurite resistance protein [Gammaproteobacteria bacterium]
TESDRAASLFHFTQTLNRQLEPEGKVELMQMLWEVAYADGRLDKYEDALMHKLADLLYVPVRDLMRAKERAQEKARER